MSFFSKLFGKGKMPPTKSPSRPDELIAAVYRKDYGTLDKLLRASDANVRDEDGTTPLMHAVLAEDADPRMVRFLVEHGADVNAAETAQHWTALHFAARDQKAELVDALLDSGAQTDPTDVFGNTPLWRCVMNNAPSLRIVKQLLAHGADAERKNKQGVSPKDTARNMGNAEVLALLEHQ